MLLWILMILGWGGVLFLAITVFRVAGHVDKKLRTLSARPRRRGDQAA
ncbi:MAG: hypothetical protein ACM3SW_19750 [Actinomycetota bacterium]